MAQTIVFDFTKGKVYVVDVRGNEHEATEPIELVTTGAARPE